jgi:hypothetical protein
MMGKVLACTVVGGATLAVYMVVFNDPQPYPIAPPLKPLHIMTNTPTTTPSTIDVPDLNGPLPTPTTPTTTPFPQGLLCDAIVPTPPNCPQPKPAFVPAHPGEIIV